MPENPNPPPPERLRLTRGEAERIRTVCEIFEAACQQYLPRRDDRLRACAVVAIAEATVRNAD